MPGFSDTEFIYDARLTFMTLSATCAIGEVSRSRSFYRAEQYDSDLGLYYLRARYYNPLNGRFMSKDPIAGSIRIPIRAHKYLYAGANPVAYVDPRGMDEEEYEIKIGASEFASRFIAAVSCGAFVGILAASAEVDLAGTRDGLRKYWPVPVAATIGCAGVIVPFSLDGPVGIVVDLVGSVGCATGIGQAVDDFNKTTSDLASSNTEEYSSDLYSFQTDLISSIIGCGLSGLGAANDFAGYSDYE